LPLLAAAKAVGLGLIFKVVQAFASVAISFDVVEACCVQATACQGRREVPTLVPTILRYAAGRGTGY
jgi:hypothetical protein